MCQKFFTCLQLLCVLVGTLYFSPVALSGFAQTDRPAATPNQTRTWNNENTWVQQDKKPVTVPPAPEQQQTPATAAPEQKPEPAANPAQDAIKKPVETPGPPTTATGENQNEKPPASVPSSINTNLHNLSAKVYSWYISGESHLWQDEFALATLSFSEVVKAAPKFPDAYLKRAISNANLNDAEKARTDIKEFVRLSADRYAKAEQQLLGIAREFQDLAEVAVREKRSTDAVKNYERSLLFASSSAPLSAQLLLAEADTLYAQNEFAEALKSYRRAQEFDPQDSDVLARVIVSQTLPEKPQDFVPSPSDCERLEKLRATPFSQLLSSICRREQQKKLTPPKPVNMKRVFEVDEVTQPAKITNQPNAEYTKDDRAKNITGDIELSVVLATNGRVYVLEVLKPLGSEKLINAAKEAALKVQFTPAQKDQQPVAQRSLLRYSYPPPNPVKTTTAPP